MEQAETTARLRALHKGVERLLQNPRSRYFDPAEVLELFDRWSIIRDALRRGFPGILGDLAIRATPASSGTSDNEGRGYITRPPIEQIYSDMQYAVDTLTAANAFSGGHRATGTDDKTKNTGRTLWDFLTSLFENRTVLYWTNAIGWLLIIGAVASVASGYVSVQIKGTTKSSSDTATSPYLWWHAFPVNASQSDCEHISLQAIQRAGPYDKLEATNVEDDLVTNVVDFGSLMAWISCIRPHQHTLIFIASAGGNLSDVKNKTAQLQDLVTARLPRQ
jgi:hypothetical protein